ncbi:hypothetical protein FQN54_004718 [Arachnomyces sp. PD_36]|nr:hypothetical protein FQN54_004718 [Arachnomyces sp. PD_36]
MDFLIAIDNFVTSFLTGRFWAKNSYKQQPAIYKTNTTTAARRGEGQSQESKWLPSCSVKLPPNFHFCFLHDAACASHKKRPRDSAEHAPQYSGGREERGRYRSARPRRGRHRDKKTKRSPSVEKSIDLPLKPYPEEHVKTLADRYRINDQISTIIEMSKPFPYTYISCPCTDTSIPGQPSLPTAVGGNENVKTPQGDTEEDDEKTFDPRSPRANYSLYPPEHLLYCEDCHQIKCPRCITEEIVCWYCPNCLFETPSSMVKSEGNRCARNCFSCPVCTSPLAVTTLESSEGGSSQQGPWILVCGYCMWSTLDVGIKFDKPTNLRAQLSKIENGETADRKPSRTNLSQSVDFKSPLSSFSSTEEQQGNANDGKDKETGTGVAALEGPPILDATSRFSALKTFYRTQIAETSSSPADPLMAPEFGNSFSSPSALNRIMSLYTSSGLGGLYGGGGEKPKSKPPIMREALTSGEGLRIPPKNADLSTIQRMVSEECGWDGLASSEQRTAQPPGTRFIDDLRPLPVLLRTKRSKRCKSCKHILVKPEFKPQSTRFRIRLIALSYIPLITLRPLNPTPPPLSLPPAAAGSSAAQQQQQPPDPYTLTPLKPTQFLLTLKNMMFDPIKITLATPSHTPGRISSRVTVLCPQFDVGANSDVWDEALQSGSTDPRLSRSGRLGGGGESGGEKVAEAGKVWEKGRNWTSVVVEVVPGSLGGGVGVGGLGGSSADAVELEEDDDVLEIPVFVRVEWEGEGNSEEPMSGRRGAEAETVKRELAYWVVLGVGRIKGGF